MYPKVENNITLMKVDENFPIPEGITSSRTSKYPLHLLRKRGQSMFFPANYATKGQVQTAASVYARKKDKSFKYITKTEGAGCRIWKI